jgi:hypothetical protein
MGAEGLAGADGEVCALADDPERFADKIIELLADRESAGKLAVRARDSVVNQRDMRTMTRKLEQSYRATVRDKRSRARATS